MNTILCCNVSDLQLIAFLIHLLWLANCAVATFFTSIVMATIQFISMFQFVVIMVCALLFWTLEVPKSSTIINLKNL